MKKRFLAGLLTLAMLLTMAPVAFAADSSVGSYEALVDAIDKSSDGDTITLSNDIIFAPKAEKDGLQPQIIVDKSVTLDLNNHKIAYTDDSKEGNYTGTPVILSIMGGATVTITGNGTIDAELGMNNSFGINVAENSKLIVENGNFYGATTAIQVQQGSLIAYDGNFDLATTIKRVAPQYAKYIVNCIDAAFKDGTAKIQLIGGTYGYNFANKPEGEGTTYLPSGYEITEEDGIYRVNTKSGNVAKIGDVQYATLPDAIEAASTGDTVKLLADITSGVTIQKKITLDLNGHTMTKTIAQGEARKIYPVLYVFGGNVTLADTSAAKSGSIACDLTETTATGAQSCAVYVYMGSFTLQDDINISASEAADGDSSFGVYVNQSTFNMENGSVDAGSVTDGGCGVAVLGDELQSKFTMKDGLIRADGFAIAGNGMADNTEITIEGGSIKATSLGIYHPQVGNLTMTGGEIVAPSGIQYCGTGIVKISGDAKITATGAYTEFPQKPPTQGDGSTDDGAALALISRGGGYQDDGKTMQVYITGGTLTSQNNAAIAVYRLQKVDGSWVTNAGTSLSNYLQVLTISGGKLAGGAKKGVFDIDSAAKDAINVIGGYFTSDPSDYCGTVNDVQQTGIYSGDASYPYTVGVKETAENADPAPVESGMVSASVPDNASDDVKAAAETMKGVNLEQNNVIEAATKEAAENNSIKASTTVKDSEGKDSTVLKELKDATNSNSINESDVKIVYQTYIEAELNEVKQTKADGEADPTIHEITVNLTPMYRVIATTNDVFTDKDAAYIVDADLTADSEETPNAIQIGEPTKLDLPSNAQYDVAVCLPDNFTVNVGDKLSVKHNITPAEYYTGTVAGAGITKAVEFTTNGFSPFTISTAAAFIGETAYPTLQEAVENVKNNETINLAQDVPTDTKITVARSVSFKVNTSKGENAGNYNFATGNIIAGANTTVEANGSDSVGYTYKFTYTRPSSGSGSTSTTYAVNVNAATNGAVAADKKTASKGTTVTVTATPSAGYVVDSVKVVDKDGKDVAVTVKDGKYVFTMPASAVTVTATFKAETPAPSGLPFTDVKSGDWFYDAVKYAYENGLMNGTSETIFAPNGTMNRAMIVTVLYRLEKSPAVTAPAKFTDVPAGQWYSDAVAWAAANNIVNGYDETTFGPLNAVTREQMAAILYRYEQYKGLENVTLEENLSRFPDKDKISSYAVPALQWAVGQKVINGNADGTLDPTGTATRAQVAQIFMNLLNK